MCKRALLLSALAGLFGAVNASADIIDFESFSGPSTFGGAEQTLTIPGTSAGTVTITGGTILTAESNLPADETTVYGTASFGTGLSQTITLTFANPISNFFVDVYNGQVQTDTFTVADNDGHSVTEAIASNGSSGNALVSFPAVGTQVTITTNDSAWDFSIDNVGFDQATPNSTSPEPASITLMLTGSLVLGGILLWRRRQQA